METRSDIVETRPGVSVEAARRLTGAAEIALFGAFTGHVASAAIPNATRLGPIYGQLVAPELALHGTNANAYAGGATARIGVASESALLLGVLYGSVSPAGGTLPEHTPDGGRSMVSVLVGLQRR